MRLRPLLGTVLVGGAVLLVGPGCDRRTAPAPTLADVEAERAPVRENWGTRFEQTRDGRPRLHIEAAYMAFFETDDSTYTVLSGPVEPAGDRVTVHIFDAEGDSSATLWANEVFVFEDEDRYEARGNVVVVSRGDRRLQSEHLAWLEAQRRIRTPGFVRITTPDEQIQGFGLEADEDLETYQFGRITGQVTIQEKPSPAAAPDTTGGQP